MAHPKKANPAARSAKGQQPKKRYVKPSMRRLGSVRELTQTNPTNLR